MTGKLWQLIMQSIDLEKYGLIRGNTNWRKVKIQRRETVFGANDTIYSITNLLNYEYKKSSKLSF